MDDEAAVAGRDRGKVDLRRKVTGVAEHHVAVAREDAGVAGAIAVRSSDDEVVKAVAVDVPGRGYRKAGLIRRVLAMDDEAAVAGSDRGEVDLRREAGGLAERHVAVACAVPGVAGTVAVLSPDDDVVEAVAVDVPRRGHRIAGLIARVLAVDDEAARPGGHIHQIDRHVLRSVSLAKRARGQRQRALGVRHHLAGRLVAGSRKGLEPRCRPLEFVWRFAGDSYCGIGLPLGALTSKVLAKQDGRRFRASRYRSRRSEC